MFQHHNQFVSAAVGLVLHAATQLSEVRYGTQPKERCFFLSPCPLCLSHDNSDAALPAARAPVPAQCHVTTRQLLFWNDFSTRVERKVDFSIWIILWPANYSRHESLVLTSTFCSFYFLNVIKTVHLHRIRKNSAI